MIYDGYDCVIDKPEMDDIFIAHYGVKGMKWRHRKGRKKSDLRSDRNRRPIPSRNTQNKQGENLSEKGYPRAEGSYTTTTLITDGGKKKTVDKSYYKNNIATARSSRKRK